jgi:hypothetical protein
VAIYHIHTIKGDTMIPTYQEIFAENSTITAAKPRGRPFPKGISPNPAGRPKELQGLREKARERTDEALEVLAGIMHNKYETGASRVAAANSILDRGYGKPTQYVEQDIEVYNSEEIVLNSLKDFLRFLSHEERNTIMMLYRRYKSVEATHNSPDITLS